MTLRTLRVLLDGLEDLSEFVLGPPAAGQEPGLRAAWLEAEGESEAALQLWWRERSEDAYAVYRAAADLPTPHRPPSRVARSTRHDRSASRGADA